MVMDQGPQRVIMAVPVLPLQNHFLTLIISWLGLRFFKEEFQLFLEGVSDIRLDQTQSIAIIALL